MAAVGLLLVASGAFGLFALWTAIGDPMARPVSASNALPADAQIVMSVAGPSIDLFCGAAILLGRNWGRLLYVGWGAFAIAVGLAASPFAEPVLVDLAILAVIAFLLFRAPADAFFGRRPAARQSRAGARAFDR